MLSSQPEDEMSGGKDCGFMSLSLPVSAAPGTILGDEEGDAMTPNRPKLCFTLTGPKRSREKEFSCFTKFTYIF